MEKSMKKSVILLLTIILAAGLIGCAKKEEKETAKKEEAAGVFLTDLEDVTYVQYSNPDEKVTLVKDGEVWTSEGEPERKLVSGFVQEKVDVLSKIDGELMKDLVKEDCGLDEPMFALIIKNEKTTVHIFFGFDNDGYCYAMVDGSEDIYKVEDKVANVLNMTIESFAESDGNMAGYYQGLENDAEIADGEENENTDEGIIESTENEAETGDFDETETPEETEGEPEGEGDSSAE